MSDAAARKHGARSRRGTAARRGGGLRPAAAWPAAAAALVLLVLAAPSALALDPPEVEAVFRVDSEQFASGLGSRKGEVEREVSEWLAGRADGLYGFLRWRAAGQPPAAAGEDHALILSLVQDDGALCAPAFSLVFTARISGTEVRLPAVPRLDLGTFCSDPAMPTADADAAVKLVVATVDRALDGDLREILERQPLGRISLAREIGVEDRSVVLPFSLGDLRASKHTELLAEFESVVDGDEVEAGELVVRAALPQQANVRCEVLKLLFHDFQMGSTPLLQHDRFDAIFGSPRLRSLDLFMHDYDAALVPAGGSIDDVRTSL